MVRLFILLGTLATSLWAASTPTYGSCKIASSIGPCVRGKPGPCFSQGYACDSSLTQCCPTVNVVDSQYQLGPAVGGACPVGFVAVYGLPNDASNNGVCIDVTSTTKGCSR